jgi:uncharacterized protein YcfJ
MRKVLALVAIAAFIVQPVVLPTVAQARSYSNDPCIVAKHKAGDNGTVGGAVLGAIVGSAVAGKGDRGKGAIVGGALGAAAGHSVGVHNYNCTRYPRRVSARAGCHWVSENGRSFEICRNRDGTWRPSGRA